MITTDESERIIQKLFQGIDGQMISRKYRNTMESFDLAHSYGEVPLNNFFRAMDILIKPTDSIFYDLGSGLGKLVFGAALSYPFSVCKGIDIIQPLVYESEKALQSLNQLVPEIGSKAISFIHSDYYDEDFSNGDIIMISIMPQILEAQLNGTLILKLSNLRFGARVITSQVPIKSPQFEYITTIPDTFAKGAIGELHLHMKK